MSNGHGSFRLSETPVHLGLGAATVVQEQFSGEPSWYERDAERNAADGDDAHVQ